jgi:glycosyltransferase involved in cell wall biosynthesis
LHEDLSELIPLNLIATVEVAGPGGPGRGVRERYSVGRALRRHGVHLVHGAKHLLPRTPLPTVLTVQDVMLLTWPQMFTFGKRLLLPRQYLASMRDATRIITPTMATRNRVREISPELGDKTVVVANGVSPTLTDTFGIPLAAIDGRPFALVVGDLSPRKNVGLLIDIWDDVAAASGLTLVAVGPTGWGSADTRRRLEALVDRGLAVWAHHVSDAQLRWCYENTCAVLMPSIEEGFGLPVVEALALGAPVIASTDAALVEVGQGRAQHLDAHDEEGWTAAIVAAATRPRAQSAADALTLATWNDCAAGTVEVYRQALTAPRGRDA